MSRRFLFVDESGDPGSESKFFLIAVVDLSRDALSEWRRLVAPYRHHNGLWKEMKSAGLNRTGRPYTQACDLLTAVLGYENAAATVSWADKTSYTGPYLGRNGSPVVPLKFRNFLTRMTFERHFQTNPVIHPTEVEVVFDRISLNQEDRQNLEQYLSNNHRLPTFHDYTHVDSDYVDTVFLPDLAVTVVKDWLRGNAQPCSKAAMELLTMVDLTAP